MSSKYSRTLLTTCASVLALGLISTAPSYAGFEWTPPEKKEMPAPVIRDVPPAVVPAPVIRAPLVEPEPAPYVETVEPVIMEKPAPVIEMPPISEDVPDDIVATPEPLSEPVLQVKKPKIAIPAEDIDTPQKTVTEIDVPVLEEPEVVLEKTPVVITPDIPPAISIEDDLKDMPIAAENTVETVEDTVPVVIDDMQDQTDTSIEEALSALPDESVPSLVRDVKPDVPDEEIIEESVSEALDKVDAPTDVVDIVPQQDNSLAIQPFPETDKSASSNDAVVLPNDDDIDLKDLQPEDVVVKDEFNVQEPAPMESISWDIPEDFYTIEGFGSDLPLALALRQIVPAQYAFSFGSGVNPGASVSWDGGKPWNEVLGDTLDTIDVEYTLNDQKVILKKKTPAAEPIDEKPMDDKQGALKDDAVKVANLVATQSKPNTDQVASSTVEEQVAHADVESVVPKIQSMNEDSASPLDNIYGKQTDSPYEEIETSAIVPEKKPSTSVVENASVLADEKKKNLAAVEADVSTLPDAQTLALISAEEQPLDHSDNDAVLKEASSEDLPVFTASPEVETAQNSVEKEKKSFGGRVLGFFGLGKKKAETQAVQIAATQEFLDTTDSAQNQAQNDVNALSADTLVELDAVVPETIEQTPLQVETTDIAANIKTDQDNAPINLVEHQGLGQGGIITSAEDAAILSRLKRPTQQLQPLQSDSAVVVLSDDAIASVPIVKRDSALGKALHMSAKPAAIAASPDIEPEIKFTAEPVEIAKDDIIVEAEDVKVAISDISTKEISGILAPLPVNDESVAIVETASGLNNDVTETIDVAETVFEEVSTPVAIETHVEDTLNVRVWQAKDGKDLRRVLTRWSVIENVKLEWTAEEKYSLDKDVFVKGTFENAVETLFGRGMSKAPAFSLSTSPDYVLRVSD